MILIAPLALASVCSWTYAGFTADPAPRVLPPPPSAALVSPAKAAPPPSPSRFELALISTRKPPTISEVVTPVRYQMADLGGQVWEHPDATALQAFVLERNRALFGATPCVPFCR